jgi:hypothetical protein
MHYSYSAIAIFWPNKVYILRESTQIGAKITGIGFLLFIITMLLCRYRKLLFENIFTEVNKFAGLSFLLWLFMITTHWITKGLNNEFPTPLTMQNIFSSCLLCIIFIGFGAVLPQQPKIATERLEKFCNIIAIIISLIVLIAAYEIITLHAWCGAYKTESNEYVWRASSILFNPNLLGFWCVFVALFAGFIFHTKILPQKLPILIIVLCGLGMFLSGSRSSFLISFLSFSLITMLLLFQKKNRLESRDIFLPFGVFIVSILSAIIIVKIGIILTDYEFDWLKALSLLADRFVFIPVEILSFTLIAFSNHIEVISKVVASAASSASSHLQLSKASAISIHGRFSKDLVDNGYLVMLEDASWTGLTAWIIIWLFLFYIAMKAYRRSPGVKNTYALTMIFSCAFSAVFVRSFQVFPFWVLMSLVLGLCVACFNLSLIPNSLQNK